MIKLKKKASSDSLVLANNKFEYTTSSVEFLHTSGLNEWAGWTCSTGIRNLYIDFDGDIYRGVCKQNGSVGNIYDGTANMDDLKNNAWVNCTKKSCFCGADMFAPKVKNKEDKSLFFNDNATIKNIPLTFKDDTENACVFSTSNEMFKFVTWEIGRRCNFDCWYCAPNSHNNYEAHRDFDTLYSAYKFLESTWTQGSKTKFNVTGGEPTVYKDYLPFVKKVREDGHVFVTTTNGSNSPKYYAELANYSDVCFSIHLEYVKKFGMDKFLNSIAATVSTRNEARKNNTIAQYHWIGVRIMVDPGNQPLAEELYNICKERFKDIVLTVDLVHDAKVLDIKETHSYTEKEILWIKSKT